MRNLIIVRHSYAENGYDTLDFERELSVQGVVIAQQQANILRDLKIIPDKIVTSPAKRATQTAEIFRDSFDPEIPMYNVNFLYENYTTQAFISLINNTGSSNNNLLIVAHNPTLSTVAFRLSHKLEQPFLPCSMAILKYDVYWFMVEPENAVKVKFYSSAVYQ